MKERINYYDFSYYQLGIFWSIASISGQTTTIRHNDNYYLEEISKVLDNKIYCQIVKNKSQYVLKSTIVDIDSFKANNWTERNSKERELPKLESYEDFLRAYIEIHSCLDYSTRYRKKPKKEKYKGLRLRIYGNWKLINNINSIFNKELGLKPKSPQKTQNDTTKYISFASQGEINQIFEFINGFPRNDKLWKEFEYKLENPMIK